MQAQRAGGVFSQRPLSIDGSHSSAPLQQHLSLGSSPSGRSIPLGPLPAGGFSPQGPLPSGRSFSVGDAVKCWSVSSNKWFLDGKVLNTSDTGVHVEYEGGTLSKLIPHEFVAGVLARLKASDFVAGEQVALWSNSSKAWFNNAVVKEVTCEGVVVRFNGGSMGKLVLPSHVHEVLRKVEQTTPIVSPVYELPPPNADAVQANSVSMRKVAVPAPVQFQDELSRSLATSLFKRLYDMQDPVKFQDELLRALREILEAYATSVGDTQEHADESFEVLQRQAFNCKGWEALSHCDHKEVAKIAVVVWTSTEGRTGLKKPFCNILNHVLRQDSGDALRHAVVFTRAMTSHIVNPSRGEQRDHSHWPEELVSYRGTKMPRAELDFFVKDKLYRVPMFMSTSFYEEQAYVFLRNTPESELVPVMFRFVIDPVRKCDHAMYIAGISQLQDEHELLYAPYSAFRVMSVDIPEGNITWDQPAIIEIQVQPNNASVPEDVPLAPWH